MNSSKTSVRDISMKKTGPVSEKLPRWVRELPKRFAELRQKANLRRTVQ